MSKKFRNEEFDRDGVVFGMLKDVPLPRMALVKQHFDASHLEDIPTEMAKQFDKAGIGNRIHPGMSVAITVGSRGLANIPLIVKEIVRNVKRLGGKPFIVPAMGSHGGATAEGQRSIVEGLGVTESFVDAPIRATMETVPVGISPDGKEVRIDANAAVADGIIVLGRVKPHTAFRGKYESGLFKMMAIGLGKQQGAQICHDQGFGMMAHNVEQFGNTILQSVPILFGIAIVENAFDETALIEAVPKEAIPAREPELLETARSLMARIGFKDIDIMVIDKIGKNYSGDGMDPNITASYSTPYASGGPNVQRYVVLDLSEETHGNALGAGQADFVTKRLFNKLDFDAAYPNALTCTVVSGVRVPLILNTDRLALQAAVFTCVGIDKRFPRIVRIANSSHVDAISVSEALRDEVRASDGLEFLSDFKPFCFDEEGNLDLSAEDYAAGL
ncbi:nickel pincer cofactor-dependent isomerase, group 22 [Sediminispirochaeta bajacaliforniensis]|uniref:lactate racemase domain-containing protein n=1 Tax=Sediminispirochaeta bajacaliforniensis TaxID=148 RepID=UPI00036EEE54|nr:lactate racemase domain-containing protein [Sediminispirochaeta bajacaliforniensis]